MKMNINKYKILEEYIDFSTIQDEKIRKNLEKFHQESINLIHKKAPNTKVHPDGLSLIKVLMYGGFATKFLDDGTSNSEILFRSDKNLFVRLINPFFKLNNKRPENNIYNLMSTALGFRHEVYEAIEYFKKGHREKRPLKFPDDMDGRFKLANGSYVGMHMTANVLNWESLDIYKFINYPSGKFLRNLRLNITKEYKVIYRDIGIDLTQTKSIQDVLKNEKIILNYEKNREESFYTI